MSTFDYDDMLMNVVVPNMEEFGFTTDLYRSGSTDTWIKKFNPIESRNYWENIHTGEIVYTDPTEESFIFPITVLESSFMKGEIDGDFIIHGDKKYYIKPGTIIPVQGDQVVDMSIKYRIYHVNVIKPADVVLLYEVYARV